MALGTTIVSKYMMERWEREKLEWFMHYRERQSWRCDGSARCKREGVWGRMSISCH